MKKNLLNYGPPSPNGETLKRNAPHFRCGGRHVKAGVFAASVLLFSSLDSFSANVFIPAERSVNLVSLTQNQVIGTVADADGTPLSGVSIKVVGASSGGATTDGSGKFILSGVTSNDMIEFSYLGFENQLVRYTGQASLQVRLVASTSSLDEVVVIGYGTAKRSDLTGAVSQVNTSKLKNEAPKQIQDILRGNVAGLNVGFSGSAKGGGDLQVRGRTSLNASTTPLVVLDGAIYYGSWEDINPNDIETIDVLKDASSAAVFGAKSSSGVILITTKKGKLGKPVININTTVGASTMAVNERVRDANSFVPWRSDVMKSIKSNYKPYQYDDPRTLPSNISTDDWLAYDGSKGDPVDVWLRRLNMQAPEIANYKAGKSVDWYSEVFQTGLRQDYNVSISGRTDDVSYYLGGGYLKNEGIVRNDEYNTVRTRANIEANVTNFLTVGVNTQFSVRDESSMAHDGDENTITYDWGQIRSLSPWGSQYDDKGELIYRPNTENSGGINPGYNRKFTDRLRKTTALNTTLSATLKLPFGIKNQFNFTPQFQFYERYNHQSAKHVEWAKFGGRASRQQQKTYNWQVDNILTWNKTFAEDHRLDLTFLVNAEKFQRWDNKMTNEKFDPNDDLGYHNPSSGINPVISADDQYSTGDALMARAFYAYKDRYMLTGTFRRDGYSAFGQGNPRANFGAVALGWVFSEESFVNNDNWFNYGKLRLSWGSNGNRDIGRYVALADITTGKYSYVKPDGTLYYVSQLWVSRMANAGLRWERKTSVNLGLDFSLFKNRVDGSLDVYQMNSTDLLVQRSLPDVTGFDWVMDNLGNVRNRGIELTVNSMNIQRENFTWRSGFNFQLNRNKIMSLYGNYDANGKEIDDVSNKWFIGRAIDEVWDWNTLGVWQTGQEEEAAKYGQMPGDYRLEDVNGDGKFTNDDKKFLGFSAPRFRTSLRNEFGFLENFTFSFFVYANWGHMASFNELKSRNGFPDRENSYEFPYWTPENPSNEWARINSNEGGATGFNVYRKKSFLRVDNISFAYNIPSRVLTKYNIRNLRVFANVKNAFAYAPDWSFWDPENSGPTPRNYTFGIDISL